VFSAISEIGYELNPVARNLATRRSQTIGIITLDTSLVGPTSTLHSIVRAADLAGYFVSIASLQSVSRAAVETAVRQLTRQSVDGVIVRVPRSALTTVMRQLVDGLPAVVIDGPARSDWRTVTTDSETGAATVVQHLLDLGHDTVHFVRGWSELHASALREAGWRRTLRKARRRVCPPVGGDWSAQSGYEAATRLAQDKSVTAVFLANDQMALGALHAFADAGISVPRQISVAGFDDIPEAAHFLPPLTTVRQDFDTLGQASVAALLAQLGRSSAPAQPLHQLVGTELVIRESTRAPLRTRLPRP
jgi:DNA-binding LacI/PurR family transcriptional regulator